MFFFFFLLIASLLTCKHCAQTFNSAEEITMHRYSCDMTRRKATSDADISETNDRYVLKEEIHLGKSSVFNLYFFLFFFIFFFVTK